MDFFDERILAALKDDKPRSFTTLLSEVGFSHNTLQQHLDRLDARALSSKRKWLQTVWEDPNSPTMFHPQQQSR
jgi:predicted ArsR family transcriptional regulator